MQDTLQNKYKFSTNASLLYIKSPIETDAAIDFSCIVNGQKFEMTTNMPHENIMNTLTWYIQNILNSKGIIFHILNENIEDNALHNAKVFFACGLAYGLGKPI